MTNQPGTVELLIKAGAQSSIVDKHGNTAMHLAVIHNAIECLTVLLKYTRPWVTKNKPFPELDCKNFEGLTPIHIAADKNNIKAVKLLVHGKADVNIPDGKCGRTALHFASISQDLSIAGCLLLEVGIINTYTPTDDISSFQNNELKSPLNFLVLKRLMMHCYDSYWFEIILDSYFVWPIVYHSYQNFLNFIQN